MPTPRTTHDQNAPTSGKPPLRAEEDTELADELEGAAEEDSDTLKELSFDDDSRSDRHRAVGSEQSAQSDNAPDENVDELDDGNDIGEQDED